CLEYLRRRPDTDPTRLAIVGRGTAGIVALHAAFHPAQPACAVIGSLGAYRSIVESDRDSLPPSAFLPGVLLRYDLPALAGALAPGRSPSPTHSTRLAGPSPRPPPRRPI